MLDNLGFGEIFFLGLLLFLFLGPDRLPQLAARLGRWVSNLTRYSGAFMNEWRDEVLAMHDAMEEVKGLRDEIAAAQAEIVGTLYETRSDLGGAVEGARQDVGQQLQRATRFVPEGPAAGPAAASSGASRTAPSRAALPGPSATTTAARSDGAAVDKTQQVVDQLLAKRTAAPASSSVPRGEPQAAPERASPGSPTQPPPSPADLARLRDQVRDLGAEMEELRAIAADMRAALQAQQEDRAPVAAGKVA
jgi:Sec-independent protein translocase protein TatA